MSLVFPNLKYGTVIGRFLVQLADSTDADLNPDVYPASGYMVFTPGTNFASFASATPDPAILFPQPVIGVLDSDGYLCAASFDSVNNVYARTIDGGYVPTTRGVSLQATDDTALNPHDWSWRVEYRLQYQGKALEYSGFNFTLPANTRADLTLLKPVETRPGEYTIIGPQGPRGEKGDKGDPNTLSVGTVEGLPTGQPPQVTITGAPPNQTMNLRLPAGPVGPAGGPIPPGGIQDQSIYKNSSGGYEWRTPSVGATPDNYFPNGSSTEYTPMMGWDSSAFETVSDAPSGLNYSVRQKTGISQSVANPFNGGVTVEAGEDYIFESWVKADKAGSILTVEMVNQTSASIGVWTSVQENAASTSFPIANYTVPTSWTKVQSRVRIGASTVAAYMGFFRMNQSGAVTDAKVSFSGLKFKKITSQRMLSQDVQDHLMTSDDKSKLNSATSSPVANSIAQRNSTGGVEFNSVTLTDTTALTSAVSRNDLNTLRSNLFSELMSSPPRTSQNLNDLTTPGVYHTQATATSQNTPHLVGIDFGGRVEVVEANGRMFIQTMTITGTYSSITGATALWTPAGNSHSSFMGMVASRAYTYYSATVGWTWTPWTFQGATPWSESGITTLSTAIAGIRYPMRKRINNGELEIRGTVDLTSSYRSGKFGDLHASLACEEAQFIAVTEAAGGWGKFGVNQSTAMNLYINTANVNWVTMWGTFVPTA